jgi:error-prone DNA polymerase
MSQPSPSAASSRSRASAATASRKATRSLFAKLVYVSSWIKCHHPAVFACALLNSPADGLLCPAQIVRDAREHGRRGSAGRYQPQRLGQWAGKEREWRFGRCASAFARSTASEAAGALAHRGGAEGGRLRGHRGDLRRRAGLPARALRLLADADAFRSLGLGPAQALWAVRRLPDDDAAALRRRARELGDEPDAQRCRKCRWASMWWPITRPCACR